MEGEKEGIIKIVGIMCFIIEVFICSAGSKSWLRGGVCVCVCRGWGGGLGGW